MPRKEASITELKEQIRHVLGQILGREPTILVEKSLRIILPKQKPKQKKQITDSSRWWSRNSETHDLPPGWRAEVIDLATHEKSQRGGGGAKARNCMGLQRPKLLCVSLSNGARVFLLHHFRRRMPEEIRRLC